MNKDMKAMKAEIIRISGIDAGENIYPAESYTAESSKALVAALDAAGYNWWK